MIFERRKLDLEIIPIDFEICLLHEKCEPSKINFLQGRHLKDRLFNLFVTAQA